MQAVEQQKKSVTVSADVHRKIVSLRRGNQTYGDVVAESIKALEEKEQHASIPCIDDIDMDELEEKERIADADFENRYVGLEESMKRYAAEHKKA
jgi:predicted CopG family antitoxin